ncbi:MAG: hypothetical protein PHN49_05935 [Candidatus Omnitrophica bacterium]|nr:hypothetical protein [Candidatus Omnitrophota bacterium]MDD5671158.1 hypothetical protein [Candidatus Omnitrophota bacterium]
MRKFLALAILLFVAITPTLAFAASPWTEKETYGDRVAGKLEFGLKNVLLGWVDLAYEPNKALTDNKNLWGGLGKGITDTVMNEVGGAVQLVTFMIPVDLPLPDNGVDLG